MDLKKEGNLQASKRLPIPWQDEAFWDVEALEQELERVFDICHGCRRCVSLCESFPTLFDLVDESDTLAVDGVVKSDYGKVVDECYLCDLCAEIKCPYLPPHDWAVDFPHLMLRAKAQKFAAGEGKWRDRLISNTDQLLAKISQPVVAPTINVLNRSRVVRTLIEASVGIHKAAPLPKFQSQTAPARLQKRQRQRPRPEEADITVQAGQNTTGKVALFSTCYGHYIAHDLVDACLAVFRHNHIKIDLLPHERCCGMPKLGLGDLNAVADLKTAHLPALLDAINDGYDLIAPMPSCVLMFRQQWPLLFAGDQDVQQVAAHFFDPFEYLMLRHKAGLLNTDFKKPLGRVVYHMACHQRAQRIGPKTRELFALVPDTELATIERCSGYNGSYGWKKESYAKACKIAAPLVRQAQTAQADVGMSDCIMAGRMIAHGLKDEIAFLHPMALLHEAYGLAG